MVWPATTTRDQNGALTIGGVAAPALAAEFGTPLYIFDEATLRAQARLFLRCFGEAYPRSRVVYAGKAGISPAIVALLWSEGLGLDVVSGGELYAGLISGVPASAMTFHGNNKSATELAEAVAAGIGRIAIDNLWEIDLLERVMAGRDRRVPVLLRLNPGVDAHTHAKMLTGALDSKFGMPVASGAAAGAVARILEVPGLELTGYHAHVGSQIFDAQLVRSTIDIMLAFAAAMRDRHGVVPDAIDPGGGFGVATDGSTADVSISDWAAAAAGALRAGCERYGFPLPELTVEPGRAIVAPAGVALYEIGARKEIAGIRTYVSVDGGMADNIRPTLYGARYTATVANRDGGGEQETVTIAGKYCESGDVLIPDATLPRLRPGDLLAVAGAGAYCLPMASNYNSAPRPAVVLVGDGQAHLIRRRETYAELMSSEVWTGQGTPKMQ